MAKILVVEDDAGLLEQLCRWLHTEHHVVEPAENGDQAKSMLAAYGYDLLLLDWELPGCSGVELLKGIREKGILTPVLMLTGRSSIDDKETGFATGADDYLTKPFEHRELIARVRALLRRSAGSPDNALRLGELVLDLDGHQLTISGTQVKLQPKEFALLEFFLRHPNQSFSGDTLLSRIWSAESEASPNTVKSYMYTLRRKLTEAGLESLIETVHGVGYKLKT